MNRFIKTMALVVCCVSQGSMLFSVADEAGRVVAVKHLRDNDILVQARQKASEIRYKALNLALEQKKNYMALLLLPSLPAEMLFNVDTDGNTLLHRLVSVDEVDPDLVRALLNKAPNVAAEINLVCAENKKGRTALEIIMRKKNTPNHSRVTAMLLETLNR